MRNGGVADAITAASSPVSKGSGRRCAVDAATQDVETTDPARDLAELDGQQRGTRQHMGRSDRHPSRVNRCHGRDHSIGVLGMPVARYRLPRQQLDDSEHTHSGHLSLVSGQLIPVQHWRIPVLVGQVRQGVVSGFRAGRQPDREAGPVAPLQLIEVDLPFGDA